MTFWDFVFTTVVIVEFLLLIGGTAAFFFFRQDRTQRKPRQDHTARALLVLLGVALAVVLIGRRVDLQRLLHPNGSSTSTITGTSPRNGTHGRHSPAERHVKFRWEELAILVGLLLVLGAAAATTRRRLGPATGGHRGASELLAAALDESLDDLREDPNLRRAIVAAYARMETALAAAGLPRHHAEAPLEYMERALLTLDTSATAVRRLTDLFEWARFSQHEPEPSMRDDAVDALMAVRDELRAADWVVT